MTELELPLSHGADYIERQLFLISYIARFIKPSSRASACMTRYRVLYSFRSGLFLNSDVIKKIRFLQLNVTYEALIGGVGVNWFYLFRLSSCRLFNLFKQHNIQLQYSGTMFGTSDRSKCLTILTIITLFNYIARLIKAN